MKFAISLENTENSLLLLNLFFEKFGFCRNYTLDIFTVQEAENQEAEILELKKKIIKNVT